jgi:N-acetylneuraminic acid mutarotase
VKTSSLYYYAGKVTVAGADYVLTPYWYFNSSSDQWVKSASLTITPNYGKVTVTKR